MNRRSFLRLGAVAAGGLIVGEEVRDWLEWQSRRVFALGGIPDPPQWGSLWGNTLSPGPVLTEATIRKAIDAIRNAPSRPEIAIVNRSGRIIGWA